MTDSVKFERNSLYVEVWADPVSTVSKRYGLSSNGLRKICKKLGVPMPPLGYWAKLRAGRRVRRPSLPAHSGPTEFIAYPSFYTRRDNPSSEWKSQEKILRDDEMQLSQKVVVSADGHLRISLVRTTLAYLEKSDRDYERAKKLSGRDRLLMYEPPRAIKPGELHDPESGHVAIVVSREQRVRAFAITDAFFVALHERGFRISVDQDGTFIRADDISVKFRLSEITEKVERRDSIIGYDWRATGRLRITLRRVSWEVPFSDLVLKDGPALPLESQLNAAIYRLRSARLGYEDRQIQKRKAIALRAEKQKLEELRVAEESKLRALREAEELRIREEKRLEEERINNFFSEADRWAEMQRRLQYLDHIETLAQSRGQLVDGDSPLGVWLKWARAVCLGTDPTVERLMGVSAPEVDEG